MRITSIHGRGIKGWTGEQSLSGLDIITGRNGSGNTPRLQARGIALLGHAPGADKRPGATLALASDPEGLHVGLTLDSGFRFTRSFIRETKRGREGVVSVTDRQTIAVSPSRGEKTLSAQESRVFAECGNFPAALDVGEFLGMTPSQRRTFCLGLLGQEQGEAIDREWAGSYLRKSLLSPLLQANDPDGYQTMGHLIADCLDEWRPGLDPQDALQAMSDWAKSKQSEANKRARDAQGAVRELAELKARVEQTDRDLSANEDEIARLQEQLVACESDLATARERAKAAGARRAAVEDLRAQVEALGADLASPLDVSAHETALSEAQTCIREVQAPVDRSSEADELQKRRTTETARRADLTTKLAEAKATLGQAERTLVQIGAGRSVCVIHDKIGCPKDWSTAREHFDVAVTGMRETVSVLQSDLDQCGDALAAIDTRLKEIAAADRLDSRNLAEIHAANAQAQKAANEAASAIQAAKLRRQHDEESLGQLKASL